MTFTSKAQPIEAGHPRSALGTRQGAGLPVENTRSVTKADDGAQQHATPDVEVDPETYEVRADGELLTCEPAEVLPMAQRYFLF